MIFFGFVIMFLFHFYPKHMKTINSYFQSTKEEGDANDLCYYTVSLNLNYYYTSTMM